MVVLARTQAGGHKPTTPRSMGCYPRGLLASRKVLVTTKDSWLMSLRSLTCVRGRSSGLLLVMECLRTL